MCYSDLDLRGLLCSRYKACGVDYGGLGRGTRRLGDICFDGCEVTFRIFLDMIDVIWCYGC